MTSIPYWNKLLPFCWNYQFSEQGWLKPLSWFLLSVLPLFWQKETPITIYNLNQYSITVRTDENPMCKFTDKNNLILKSKLLFLNQTFPPWNQKGILHLYQSFSIVTTDILSWMICEGHAVCYKVLSSAGLCQLNASSTDSRDVKQKNIARHFKCLLGDKIAPSWE